MQDDPFNPFNDGPKSREWTIALTLGLAILICLGAFVWLFIQLDPFMADFISGADPVTPAVDAASPTAEP